jgi:hypothetical protein
VIGSTLHAFKLLNSQQNDQPLVHLVLSLLNCLKIYAILLLLVLYEMIRLFVCFESHEQFFSYLATVTITGDRAANLDLCLALTDFNSEGSFTCHTHCDTELPFLRSYPKDQ